MCYWIDPTSHDNAGLVSGSRLKCGSACQFHELSLNALLFRLTSNMADRKSADTAQEAHLQVCVQCPCDLILNVLISHSARTRLSNREMSVNVAQRLSELKT